MTTGVRRTAIILGVAVVALVTAHWLDFRTASGLAYPPASEADWGRLLRIAGYAPSWLIVAGALWLEDRRGRAALAVLASVAAAGLAAELVKLIVRRGRPDPLALSYLFRSFADHPFNSKNFGFPSSHVAVAFGGAAALGNRFRRASPIFYAVAAGCGLTRLFAGAHFLSDVVGGLLGGILIGRAVARAIDPRPPASAG